jgi:hypothetical protein
MLNVEQVEALAAFMKGLQELSIATGVMVNHYDYVQLQVNPGGEPVKLRNAYEEGDASAWFYTVEM